MSPTMLSRLSGLALACGSALFATGNLLHPIDHAPASQASPTWEAAHVTMVLGLALMALGLPGVYARQAERAGTLGLAGLVLLFVGMIAIVPGLWHEAFVVPTIGDEAARAVEQGAGGRLHVIAGLVFLVGHVAFGLATFRARVFPRAAATLLLVSAVVASASAALVLSSGLSTPPSVVAIIAGAVLLSLGYAWLGCAHVASLRVAGAPGTDPALGAPLPGR